MRASTTLMRRHTPIRLCQLLIVALFGISPTACTNLFFQPSKVEFIRPSQLGLEYEDIYLSAADGQRLHAWYLPARTKAKALGTILFLHGNAENMSTHIKSVFWLPAYGFNVFLLDYRGYGRSTGRADIDAAHVDVETAIGYLINRGGVDRKALVIFGQSLGGAIAIHAAAHSQYRQLIKGLVIESTFSSYRDIAREKLAEFWLTWPFQWPFSWLIFDRYSPLNSIGKLSPIPLIIIQGGRDPIVPEHHAWRLFQAAHEPKQLWIEPNMAHIQTLTIPKKRQHFVSTLKQILNPEMHTP